MSDESDDCDDCVGLSKEYRGKVEGKADGGGLSRGRSDVVEGGGAKGGRSLTALAARVMIIGQEGGRGRGGCSGMLLTGRLC